MAPWGWAAVTVVALLGLATGYDWGGRFTQPTCLDIPDNLTLCKGIGYSKMRLPNLLDHDSMAEVQQQARSWVQLANRRCHPDTQLFLCSLFSPVCLDRPIFPCRSLCEAVQRGCEETMLRYGYPWPDMVRCDKFPQDNDMCITVQSTVKGETAACRACHQPNTTESFVDNFCRADFVLRTRVKQQQASVLRCKKARVFKVRPGLSRKQLRRPAFHSANLTECCGELRGPLLVMGTRDADGHLVPTFIVPWRRTPAFRKSVRAMRRVDCANPLAH